MIDLAQFTDELEALSDECIRRGIPKTIRDRVVALHHVIPNIEHARQAQDRTNG